MLYSDTPAAEQIFSLVLDLAVQDVESGDRASRTCARAIMPTMRTQMSKEQYAALARHERHLLSAYVGLTQIRESPVVLLRSRDFTARIVALAADMLECLATPAMRTLHMQLESLVRNVSRVPCSDDMPSEYASMGQVLLHGLASQAVVEWKKRHVENSKKERKKQQQEQKHSKRSRSPEQPAEVREPPPQEQQQQPEPLIIVRRYVRNAHGRFVLHATLQKEKMMI
eukprot:PhM_4_TR4990/c0_g1_i1/m.82721